MDYERKDMCGIMGITRIDKNQYCETIHFTEPKKDNDTVSMFMYGKGCEACLEMTEENLEQLQELIGDVLDKIESYKEVKTFAGLKKMRNLVHHNYVLSNKTWTMKLLWKHYQDRYDVVFLEDIEEMLYGEYYQLEILLDAFEDELGEAGICWRDIEEDEDVDVFEEVNDEALEYIRQHIVEELIEHQVGSIKYDW